MAKCIICGKYCKNEFQYCKECYYSLGNCDECGKEINLKEIEEHEEILGIFCKECFEKKLILVNDTRKKWKAEYRCKDGHYVRSKSEMTIDNYLFDNNIVHAYEKKIFDLNNPSEEYTSDFYLPQYNLYIEHWGYENKRNYEENKNIKIEIYNSNNFNLLSITEENMKSIDDYLERELFKYKIKD